MITKICLLIALVLISVLSWYVYQLKKRYLDFINAYCWHYWQEHIEKSNLDKILGTNDFNYDDLARWTVNMLRNANISEDMGIFQATIYQQMIKYVDTMKRLENKNKDDNNER